MNNIHSQLLRIFESHNMGVDSAWESDLKNKIGPKLFDEIKSRQKRFSEYKSRSLLMKMYSTILGAGAIYDVNIPRKKRLENIAKSLDAFSQSPQSVLDYGAGSGLLSLAIRKSWNPGYFAVWDLCPELRYHLEAQGFAWDDGTGTFDFILCADSLGECNSDEGDELKLKVMAESPDAGEHIEAHYGFFQQLQPLLQRMNPGGCLVLTEPVNLSLFWIHLLKFLKQQDLKTRFLWDSDPTQGILIFR